MDDKIKIENSLSQNLRVGWFLAKRDIAHANKWTTALIIFVMTLTFLNLIIVSGILVGLIQGSEDAQKKYSTGDVVISSFLNRSYIDQTPKVESIVKTLPDFQSDTVRYTGGALVESNYRDTIKPGDKRDGVTGSLLGIDPQQEQNFSGVSKFVIRGSYLQSGDQDSVLLGKNLLYEFTPIEAPGFQTLKNIVIGQRVRITVGDYSKEYFVKGILSSKVDVFDTSVVALDSEVRKLTGQTTLDAGSIAIKLKSNADPVFARDFLIKSGVGEYARVQTADDASPKFLKDMKVTFGILGSAISGIGLVVASITIFIVIFVNAITRRRYIGIMKGIGLNKRAILYSYIYQAFIYAGFGIIIGMSLIFFLIKPYFAAHPINFPFSDGILVATLPTSLWRATILLITTMVAGYIPARIVIKQNTLSAILGR
ncbi:MAG: FtsX-like permease family protein [Candidatus Nomurabacteria bacterium]|nr:FtsX-like permease family protein [Candidatus Nomurabacteria bacterium]